jgi:hypothetical protein
VLHFAPLFAFALAVVGPSRVNMIPNMRGSEPSMTPLYEILKSHATGR